MHCTKCGKIADDIGELQVRNLEFDLDGRINGSLCIAAKCSTCGVFPTQFDAQLDLQVPPAHRGQDHQLEVNFESVGGSTAAGFPVKAYCSCGRLEVKGFLICPPSAPVRQKGAIE